MFDHPHFIPEFVLCTNSPFFNQDCERAQRVSQLPIFLWYRTQKSCLPKVQPQKKQSSLISVSFQNFSLSYSLLNQFINYFLLSKQLTQHTSTPIIPFSSSNIVGKNLLLDNILNKIFIFNYQTRAGNLLNFYTQLTKRWRHDIIQKRGWH